MTDVSCDVVGCEYPASVRVRFVARAESSRWEGNLCRKHTDEVFTRTAFDGITGEPVIVGEAASREDRKC